jgi:hypothetical protein
MRGIYIVYKLVQLELFYIVCKSRVITGVNAFLILYLWKSAMLITWPPSRIGKNSPGWYVRYLFLIAFIMTTL